MTTQVLVHSSERLQGTFTIDGAATDPDGLAATVTITRDDGTAIVTDGTAVRLDQGVYTFTLPTQTQLDRLSVVWSGVFGGQSASTAPATVDVVGGYFCSLAELRAMRNLENTTAPTTEQLIEARQWFETLAEEYCGQAFVPRYKRKRFSGTGGYCLFLDPNVRTIRSVKDYTTGVAFSSFTSDQLADIDADPIGTISRLTTGVWRYGRRNLEIVYEHGMDACPNDLREAAKNAIRLKLLDDNTGHREYAIQTDVGIIRFGRPGPGRPTGDDSVDAVLNRYRMVPVG